MTSEKKKELTKGLLSMKFMERSLLKNDQEEMLKNDSKLYIDDDHWVLDKPDFPEKLTKYKYVASYAKCANLKFGRQSFKGFNKDIEVLNKSLDAQALETKIDLNDKVNTIDDKEMADRYSSLINSLGKKMKTKRQRNVEINPDNDSSLSKKPLFMKPQL